MARGAESAHVHHFLNAIDPSDPVYQAAQLTNQAAARSPPIRDAVNAVLAWAARPVVAQSERLAPQRPEPLPGPTIVNADVDMLLSVGYLRAQAALRGQGLAQLKQHLENPDQVHQKVTGQLSGLTPAFVDTLLGETRARAAREPAFARTLARGKEDLHADGLRLSLGESNSPRISNAAVSSGSCAISGNNAASWSCVITAGIFLAIILLSK